jgi:hypothetical protein
MLTLKIREGFSLITDRSNNSLIEEVRYLHLSLFGRYPDNRLIDSYCDALSELDLPTAVNQQNLTVEKIIFHKLDAAGIEPWLRKKNKYRHMLSIKLLLIAYLAECDGGHTEFSRNSTNSSLAFFAIAYLSSMSFLRLTRGLFQKLRYGIV